MTYLLIYLKQSWISHRESRRVQDSKWRTRTWSWLLSDCWSLRSLCTCTSASSHEGHRDECENRSKSPKPVGIKIQISNLVSGGHQ